MEEARRASDECLGRQASPCREAMPAGMGALSLLFSVFFWASHG